MSKPKLSPSLVLGLPERSGFLLPALTVWAAIAVNLGALKRQSGILELFAVLDSQRFVTVVGLTVIGIYSVFLLGHVLDLLSNGVSERFLANKMDGYPHERIVPVAYTTTHHSKFKYRRQTNLKRLSFFFEGAKLLIGGSTMLVLSAIILRNPDLSFNLRTAISALFIYSTAAVAISALFAVPAILIRYAPYKQAEDRKVFADRIVSRLSKAFRRNFLLRPIEIMWHAFIKLALGPFIYGYDIVDRLVRGLTRLNLEIDEQTYSQLLKAYAERFGSNFSTVDNNDRFWLPYLEVQIKLPPIGRRIDEARRAANFCRNQSFACFISSILVAGIYRSSMTDAIGIFTRSDLNALALFLFVLAWLFHWKFLHHYYSFTKMTLRAFSTLASVGPKKKKTIHKSPGAQSNC
jgi:hypothetical protein